MYIICSGDTGLRGSIDEPGLPGIKGEKGAEQY